MKKEHLLIEMIGEYRKEYIPVHQVFSKNAISIFYTGAEITGTAEVKANSLELAAPALTVVETIDLTAGATNTLQEVVDAINALDDWAAVLGDQFEGSEASASLAVIAAADVKTAAVWFAQDTNLQIKIVIPGVTGKRITINQVVGKSTYSSGTSAIQVYKGNTLVWEEEGGATTAEKTATFEKVTVDPGVTATIKILNSAVMTAGALSVSYEKRDFDVVPLSV
jgi:hypothetical protein